MPGLRVMMLMALALSMVLAGCDGSGGSGGGDTVPGPNVRLSGRVTYDFVPVAATLAGPGAYLDYAGTAALPARGVQVAAIADDGRELASGSTDADGGYTLSVPKNTRVRVRAIARLFRAPGDGASWDFSIRDNTSPGYAGDAASIYAVQGDAFELGATHLSRNLHAASGWTGAGYGEVRAAAPFAILDQIFSATQKVLAVDDTAVFAPMNTYWSIHNLPSNGDKAIGEISTSHWDVEGPQAGLYILGKENDDTDEYDTGVIVHEWGHYFESKFSRADSLGGEHGGGERLDMRLAFGEAWGNALAGMVRDDPIYADTMGIQQSIAGVVMDLNAIPGTEPRGWFNEASVQHVLYQMYKLPSIGFGPIYEVMVGPQKNTLAFTSLFSFATYLRDSVVAAQGQIDVWLDGINTLNGPGLNIWGSGQLYPPPPGLPAGYETIILPVYQDLTVGVGTNVCGTDDFGSTDEAKLGNYQFLRLNIPVDGNYTLSLAPDDPGDKSEAILYSGGQRVAAVEEGGLVPVALKSGTYTVSVKGDPLKACRTITVNH